MYLAARGVARCMQQRLRGVCSGTRLSPRPRPESYAGSIAKEAERVGYIRWIVSSEEDGTRLDRFIKRQSPALPPGLIQRLIRQRSVLVDDERAERNAQAVREGMVVRFPGHVKLGLTRGKKKPKLDDISLAEVDKVKSWVLFKDARCVVLDKPSGLPTQGGSRVGRSLDELVEGLGGGRYFLVHRLDKETSGCIVVARDVGAAGLLAEMFKAGGIGKIYWGLTKGVPKKEWGVIKQEVGGKNAVTEYRVIDTVGKQFAWVELIPRTGRKHQLRRHCAEALGTPLVGDARYGDKMEEGLGGQGLECLGEPGLHLVARMIKFPKLTQNGGGGKRRKQANSTGNVTVTAPLPPHMKQSWKRFGLNEALA